MENGSRHSKKQGTKKKNEASCKSLLASLGCPSVLGYYSRSDIASCCSSQLLQLRHLAKKRPRIQARAASWTAGSLVQLPDGRATKFGARAARV